MVEKIVVPHFASESEEADWWFDNREAHGEIMARALHEGLASNEERPAMNLVELLQQRGQELPRVSLRFDYDDIALAGKQAEVRGVELESYMRNLLHEALLKDGAV